ncbi:MAG: dockerin type I domain-containing protein, partial [Solirubrobacterales bacterium]
MSIVGRATYEPREVGGIFAWGSSLEFNSQWLDLEDVEVHPSFDFLFEMSLVEHETTNALALSGLIDVEALELSGTDPVTLATVALNVIEARLPGRLTGVQLAGGESAVIGEPTFVDAVLEPPHFALWDVPPLGPDVDGDGSVSPVDALLVVNCYLDVGSQSPDVDGDGEPCTPADVQAVFAELGGESPARVPMSD